MRPPRVESPVGLSVLTARVVLRRPDLWPTALRQARRMAPEAWWRTPPFLPVPDGAWLRFRLEAQYGGGAVGPVDPSDIVRWLEWARAYDRAVGLS